MINFWIHQITLKLAGKLIYICSVCRKIVLAGKYEDGGYRRICSGDDTSIDMPDKLTPKHKKIKNKMTNKLGYRFTR